MNHDDDDDFGLLSLVLWAQFSWLNANEPQAKAPSLLLVPQLHNPLGLRAGSQVIISLGGGKPFGIPAGSCVPRP